MKIVHQFIAITALAAITVSCGNDASKDENEMVDSTAIEETKIKSQKVFFAIPSPLEISSTIKKSGANYDKTILNPTENSSKYTTSAAMALNLGIYGADLSYTTIFDQTQESLKYMGATKKLADGLGIGGALSEETISRLEKNMNNKDSLLAIVSDSYWNTDAFLKENEKGHISALVIAGGWIEGLWLATNIAQKNPKGDAILKHIADQKLTLENLKGLLETFPNDENVTPVLADINALRDVFAKLQAEPVKETTETKEEANSTTLGSSEGATEIKISKEQLAEIAAKTAEIRNKIIK